MKNYNDYLLDTNEVIHDLAIECKCKDMTIKILKDKIEYLNNLIDKLNDEISLDEHMISEKDTTIALNKNEIQHLSRTIDKLAHFLALNVNADEIP